MQEVVAPDGRHIPQGLLMVLSNRARINRQSSGLGQVGPDGTFTLAAVPAGAYDVQLASAGPWDDLYVSTIRRGDDNVLADGLRVNGPSSDPIEITLKPNGGTVEAVVRMPNGEPLADDRFARTTTKPAGSGIGASTYWRRHVSPASLLPADWC